MKTAVAFSPVNIDSRKKLGIRSGDTVRVWQKIKEKEKTRLQAFEGLVLARKHGDEPGATFTVRRVASGVGVEKVFPLFSPMIDRVEIVKRSRMRRSKLYYIRKKVAREIRRQMRRMQLMNLSSASDIADTEEKEEKGENEESGETSSTQESPTEGNNDEIAVEKEKSDDKENKEKTPTA
jgi:large subunit ribosomal protein L19